MLFRTVPWGTLATFVVVDTRQYRDDHPMGDGEHPYGPASFDPSQTVLGDRQERWLRQRFRQSRAQWNVLANQVLFSALAHEPGPNPRYWQDSWDGYPVARRRLIDDMVATQLRNPFVISGDWHSTFVNDIHADFRRPDSPVVATEFVGTSITTNGDDEVYGPYYGTLLRSMDSDTPRNTGTSISPRRYVRWMLSSAISGMRRQTSKGKTSKREARAILTLRR